MLHIPLAPLALTPLVAQVEDTLYLLHKYLFTTHARSFMSARDYAVRDIGPYILNDIKRTDFDRLLSCLYPR